MWGGVAHVSTRQGAKDRAWLLVAFLKIVILVGPGPALLGPGPERMRGLGLTSSFCFQEGG